jgi:hypothetical protein
MKLADTNNLNYLLSLDLGPKREIAFLFELIRAHRDMLDNTDLMLLFARRSEYWDGPRHAAVPMTYSIVNWVTTSKRSLPYLMAKTSVERAKILMHGNQAVIDAVFAMRKKHCEAVPELEQVLRGWEDND